MKATSLPIWIAMAAAALCSCTDEVINELPKAAEDGMKIDFYTSINNHSRSDYIHTTEKLDSFRCFAFCPDGTYFFDHIRVQRSQLVPDARYEANWIIDDGPYYFPSDVDYLDFYCFTYQENKQIDPKEAYRTNVENGGITEVTVNPSIQIVTNFSPRQDITEQEDLILAHTRAGMGDQYGGVHIDFEHALAQMQVRAYCPSQKIRVEIAGCWFCNVAHTGDVTFPHPSGLLTNLTESSATGALCDPDKMSGDNGKLQWFKDYYGRRNVGTADSGADTGDAGGADDPDDPNDPIQISYNYKEYQEPYFGLDEIRHYGTFFEPILLRSGPVSQEAADPGFKPDDQHPENNEGDGGDNGENGEGGDNGGNGSDDEANAEVEIDRAGIHTGNAFEDEYLDYTWDYSGVTSTEAGYSGLLLRDSAEYNNTFMDHNVPNSNVLLIPQQLTEYNKNRYPRTDWTQQEVTDADGNKHKEWVETPDGTTDTCMSNHGAYILMLARVYFLHGNEQKMHAHQLFPMHNKDTWTEGTKEFGWVCIPIDTKWRPGYKYLYTLEFCGPNSGAGIYPPDGLDMTTEELTEFVQGVDPSVSIQPVRPWFGDYMIDDGNGGQQIKEGFRKKEGDPVLAKPLDFIVHVNVWKDGGDIPLEPEK